MKQKFKVILVSAVLLLLFLIPTCSFNSGLDLNQNVQNYLVDIYTNVGTNTQGLIVTLVSEYSIPVITTLSNINMTELYSNISTLESFKSAYELVSEEGASEYYKTLYNMVLDYVDENGVMDNTMRQQLTKPDYDDKFAQLVDSALRPLLEGIKNSNVTATDINNAIRVAYKLHAEYSLGKFLEDSPVVVDTFSNESMDYYNYLISNNMYDDNGVFTNEELLYANSMDMYNIANPNSSRSKKGGLSTKIWSPDDNTITTYYKNIFDEREMTNFLNYFTNHAESGDIIMYFENSGSGGASGGHASIWNATAKMFLHSGGKEEFWINTIEERGVQKGLFAPKQMVVNIELMMNIWIIYYIIQ